MARNNSNNYGTIEFIVKSKEELFIVGNLRTISRVQKGESYPCQMQRNQSFSCLFRHYAKHNGLNKDDLIFSFVEELSSDQSPESVHLMSNDEVWVEHRKNKQCYHDNHCNKKLSSNFIDNMREILFNSDHYDVTFIVGPDKVCLNSHKSILSARSEYFKAMFRPGGLCESTHNQVEIPNQNTKNFSLMLEFLYTNSIKNIDSYNSDDIIALLNISNEYLLDELKHVAIQAVRNLLNEDNICKFTLLCDKTHNHDLREICSNYLKDNISNIKKNKRFRDEILESPELALFLIDSIPEAQLKRPRLKDNGPLNFHQLMSDIYNPNSGVHDPFGLNASNVENPFRVNRTLSPIIPNITEIENPFSVNRTLSPIIPNITEIDQDNLNNDFSFHR